MAKKPLVCIDESGSRVPLDKQPAIVVALLRACGWELVK